MTPSLPSAAHETWGAPRTSGPQEEASAAEESPTVSRLLVAGPPRSGRTSLIAGRVRSLMEAGVAPDAVLVLGTSPAAARVLLTRITAASSAEHAANAKPGGQAVGAAQLAIPVVDTVESFCAGVLRRAAGDAGLDPYFALASDIDRLALLLDRFGESSGDLPGGRREGLPRGLLVRALSRIDKLKGALVEADDYAEWAARGAARGDEEVRWGIERFAALYAEHGRLLAARGALDRGDLVLKTCALLAEGTDTRRWLGARYSHLVIDGLDHMSPSLALLVRRLTEQIPNVALALDEFAAVGLAPAWPQAELQELPKSLAWPALIARAAAGADRGAEGPAPAAFPPEAGATQSDTTVGFWRCPNERALARCVVSDIERLMGDPAQLPGGAGDARAQDTDGAPVGEHSSVAVLVRSLAREGQAVAGMLKERALRSRVHAPNAFLDTAEVRDVVAWLRLLADPLDVNATVRLLGRPPVGLRPVEIARANQIARRRKVDMISALAYAIESPELPPEARERAGLFLALHTELAEALEAMPADELIHAIVERSGLGRARALADDEEALAGTRSLVRLEELAAHLRAFWPEAGPREVAAYLTAGADAGLSLAWGAGEEEQGTGPCVHVLSHEAVRGMAFDRVYILGLAAPAVAVGSESSSDELDDAERPVPAELLARCTSRLGAFAAAVRPWPADDALRLRCALETARRSAVLAYAAEDAECSTQAPIDAVERARTAVGGEWEERVPGPLPASTELQARIRNLRRRVLEDVEGIAGRLGELRLDTDYDISQGVVAYLELVKLAALAERPGERGLAAALPDINARLLGACTPLERELFEASGLDRALEAAAEGADARPADGLGGDGGAFRLASGGVGDQALLASLLPRHGDGLALSASDIEVYRSCPLRYKFTRLLRIPVEPTPQQRFGIVVHQVLERFHGADIGAGEQGGESAAGRKAMSRLLEAAWRRGGFANGPRESEYFEKARSALLAYQRQLADQEGRPVWFERSFSFPVGRNLVRGRVDRIDRLPGGDHELIDYKTGHPKTLAQLEDDVQLSLYALAARRAWRIDASRLSYYYVLDNRKVTLPEGSDGSRLERITEMICDAAEGILALSFQPRPSFAVCSSCDFLSICPAAES